MPDPGQKHGQEHRDSQKDSLQQVQDAVKTKGATMLRKKILHAR